MILFVFEGEKPEMPIFRTLEYLFFPNKGKGIECCFGQNIYRLYSLMKPTDKEFEKDIVAVLQQELESRNDSTLAGFNYDDFSEICLFFDYDFQNTQLPPDEPDRRVGELLAFFYNESENIKMYISYPMSEAIRCASELTDAEFLRYEVSRKDCREFKSYAARHNQSLDFITLRLEKSESGKRAVAAGQSPKKIKKVEENWLRLNRQNVEKANYICTGDSGLPLKKSCVSQAHIFESQLEKYVKPRNSVAILSAFPLFLYEYFREECFRDRCI